MSSLTFAIILFMIALFMKGFFSTVLEAELIKVKATVNQVITDDCIGLYMKQINARSFAFAVASVLLWYMFINTAVFGLAVAIGICAGMASFIFLFSAVYGHVVSNDRPYIEKLLSEIVEDQDA
jgi:hypothetical protein